MDTVGLNDGEWVWLYIWYY